jgi:hypothetical protein
VNNKNVYLPPGETYGFNETEKLKDGNGIINVVYQHQYINHGLIDRNAVQSRMIPA